jgi:hypothetical protein
MIAAFTAPVAIDGAALQDTQRQTTRLGRTGGGLAFIQLATDEVA